MPLPSTKRSSPRGKRSISNAKNPHPGTKKSWPRAKKSRTSAKSYSLAPGNDFLVLVCHFLAPSGHVLALGSGFLEHRVLFNLVLFRLFIYGEALEEKVKSAFFKMSGYYLDTLRITG